MVSEPIESLIPKIMDQYNKHPLGWSILRDYKGNLVVLGPNNGYMLKIIPINPQEYTGVGIKIHDTNEVRKFVHGVPSYGYRPLSNKQTKNLLNGFRSGKKQGRLVSRILERNPLSIPELKKKKPRMVLGGPFLGHPDLSSISEKQRLLEAKLKIESDKLFRKKYPYRASIYE